MPDPKSGPKSGPKLGPRTASMSGTLRNGAVWLVLAALVGAPFYAAVQSPFLAWRDPIYVIAGLAGVVALCLILLQPLLIAGLLPGLSGRAGRRVHLGVGLVLLLSVVVHVGGLWITSPPDVVDALTFTAPTWFSVWGVLAMWAVGAAAALAALRARLRPRHFRFGHASAVSIAALGSVAHAMLIVGTMEMVTKTILCLAVLAALGTCLRVLRIWSIRPWRARR